ncbi:tryptophan halogenase family protein [Thalassotalea marina]|nr:tryptophan halogenase family protein [Thalassotalea marina]
MSKLTSVSMTSSKEKINNIVIVGGGTSGWMTAAALAHQNQSKSIQITLIESSKMGTIGVGEATIPTLRRFYQNLGMTDLEVLKNSAATCKLGIEFIDWHKKDTSFIHPFGIYGQGTPEVAFHHYWLRAKKEGVSTALEQFSLGVQLAKHNKFMLPSNSPESQLEIFDWALHFDAALFAQMMKSNALNNKVSHVDGEIKEVSVDSNNNIQSLTLACGTKIEADLFVDCSGFNSLLLQKAQKTGYEDWSQWLFCDSAVAVQTELTNNPLARTQSIAHHAGWQWKIPLQHRQGNGHVYCSRYIDKLQATETLLNNIDGAVLHEPRHFNFTPGRAKKAWNQNCVAIGLSSGFLEPLESTSIALVQTAIEKLTSLINEGFYNDQIISKFNDATIQEYERVRDFIILHYKLNQREDSEFWVSCQQMAIPDSLQQKLDFYLQTGNIQRLNWEIFGKDSWLAILDGFAVYPEEHDQRANNMKQQYLFDHLTYMQQRISNTVESGQSHGDFLKQHCRYTYE